MIDSFHNKICIVVFGLVTIFLVLWRAFEPFYWAYIVTVVLIHIWLFIAYTAVNVFIVVHIITVIWFDKFEMLKQLLT